MAPRKSAYMSITQPGTHTYLYLSFSEKPPSAFSLPLKGSRLNIPLSLHFFKCRRALFLSKLEDISTTCLFLPALSTPSLPPPPPKPPQTPSPQTSPDLHNCLPEEANDSPHSNRLHRRETPSSHPPSPCFPSHRNPRLRKHQTTSRRKRIARFTYCASLSRHHKQSRRRRWV